MAMGVALSRSMDAVGDLEQILVALKDIEADEEVLSGATFMVGAYLGEILRGVLGGAWHTSITGELVLEIGGSAFAPVAKARKFAAHPEGADSLVFFARAAVAVGVAFKEAQTEIGAISAKYSKDRREL